MAVKTGGTSGAVSVQIGDSDLSKFPQPVFCQGGGIFCRLTWSAGCVQVLFDETGGTAGDV